MKTSRYLEQILFYDQTPALARLFEERSSQLFETSNHQSFVEIHVQQPTKLIEKQNKDQIHQESLSSWEDPLEWSSEPDCNISSQPPSPVDHSHYLRPDPPRYVGSPGLHSRRISDSEELCRVATISKDMFRICFIRQRHSFSRLSITRDLFENLMKELRIFPRFKEFAILFGAKIGENEIAPPQLRFRRLSYTGDKIKPGQCAGFECAYGIRYVELHGRASRMPWSVRQTVIYHKYRVQGEASTWILIAASSKTEVCLDRYIKSCRDLSNINPFEIHVIIIDVALANWRPYITYLTEEITKQSDKILVASVNDKDPLQLLDIEERQVLKDFEDRIIDNLLVLDSTESTITSLIENYDRFILYKPAQQETNIESFDPVAVALLEKKKEVNFCRTKVETLHAKVQGSIKLLSSLLDLGNGYALKVLAEEARKENTTMRKLTEKSTRDAAAVKVLTIITLIYLPVTVVSNFFSTSFVSTEQSSQGSPKIMISSNAWILAAIAVPLTILTLFLWWAWARLQVPELTISGWESSLSFPAFIRNRRQKKRQPQFELGNENDAALNTTSMTEL